MRIRWTVILTALLLIAVGLTPAQADPQTNVVGGKPTEITSIPWQVAVVNAGSGTDYDGQFCGGSIVAPLWVVTAAHCVVDSGDRPLDPASIAVLAGKAVLSDSPDTSGPNTAVARIVIHPGWDTHTESNDIALLRLASPLPFNGTTVAPIGLPDAQDPAKWPAAGEAALISGWGLTLENAGVGPRQLQAATVSVLAGPVEEECGLYGRSYIRSAMLCAGLVSGGLDTCQGDSGGPLAVWVGGNPVLAGVTSSGQGCARANLPGLYTRITSYTGWINGLISQDQGLAITGPGLTFPAQTLGSAWATQSVTVTNIGMADITGVGVTVTGGDAADFAIAGSTCFTTMAAGTACQVTVQFAPDTAGSKSAALAVQPGGAQVSLAGVALEAAVVVPLTPPDTPAGLRAKATKRLVKTAWQPTARAQRYTVRLSGSSPKRTKVVATAITSQPRASLRRVVRKGSAFTVCVSAMNDAGTTEFSCIKRKRKK